MGQILHQSQEVLYVVEHPGASPFTDALHFISIRMYSLAIYYMTEAFQLSKDQLYTYSERDGGLLTVGIRFQGVFHVLQ